MAVVMLATEWLVKDGGGGYMRRELQ